MLAREGHLPVLGLAVGGLAAAYAFGPAWALPFWAAGAGAVYLFRVPRTVQTDLPLAVVSPATGVVEAVEPSYDPWLSRDALRISVRLRFPGVGALFSPANGKVTDYWTDLAAPASAEAAAAAGPARAAARSATQRSAREARERWLRAWLTSPTRYTLALVTDAGDAIVLTVSSSRSHSRLKFDRAPGEWAVRARRCGFVYFASRVDVLVPAHSRPDVRVGERVRAGTDIVATLVHG